MKARQFVNVVTKSGRGGLYSLSRIKPEEHLFYPSTAEAQAAQAAEANKPNMVSPSMVLPSKESILRLETSRLDKRLDFLPFYGRGSGSNSKILCTDSAGVAVLWDTDFGIVEAVPCLNEPKGPSPISLSISLADAPDARRPDALYVIDRFPASRNPCNFEALIYNHGWHWHRLPPPPYVNDPAYECSVIQSYALLDGGSTICISSRCSLGTYCFDTVAGEWTKAGRWTLPFRGHAEHVPEVGNLWFSIADMSPHPFCALDLSPLDEDRAPRLLYDWQELDPPEGWVQIKGSVLYLGAGKFCITKIFDIGDQDMTGSGSTEDMRRDPICIAAVLTGVEVVGVPSKLRMIKHKSFISDYIHCVL